MIKKQSLKEKKVLIFHPTIAPYRVDFFNDLYTKLNASIYLYYENLLDQNFDYAEIKKQFKFSPKYFKRKFKIGKRVFPIGHLEILKKEMPDIVIVGEYGIGFWITVIFRLFCKKKYKIISICDDSYDLLVTEKNLHSKARTLGSKYVDGLILCNEQVGEYYRKSLNVNKTFIFPIIHKDDSYRENIDVIKELANKIIDNEKLVNKRIFLFVGRISPEKNIEYLIESFVFYHRNFPENKLYLIGDNIASNKLYCDKIKNIIRNNNAQDYIVLLGRKEGIELKTWFVLGRMLILPSRYERFGAVVNEALLLGEKVAVSSKAGAAMLVNKNNGVVLNIDEKYIDFSKLSEKVEPLREYIQNIPSNMPFKYNELMQKLIDWINIF